MTLLGMSNELQSSLNLLTKVITELESSYTSNCIKDMKRIVQISTVKCQSAYKRKTERVVRKVLSEHPVETKGEYTSLK